MLVLSACPPEVRRTTRDSAIARNRRVTALAAKVFVPYVSGNSPLAEIVLLAVPANFI
jgi:predicted Rossmann fold nucleotide-binding protein DprA/Smf involved in DNA uptake